MTTPTEPAASVGQGVPSEEELLLGGETILTPPVAGNPLPPQPGEPSDADLAASRRWMNEAGQSAPATPAPRAGREGGTLFERMSNIARGAAKVPGEEEPDPARGRDPLDIPRFLNRQNNQ